MDFEKFTDRARGFVQAAQTIAIRESHQRLTPEHLLKALMDDEQGFAAGLLAKAGAEPRTVRQAADLAVSKLPKVEGGDGFRLLSNAGPDAHQEVPHLHVHLFAGAFLGPMIRVPDRG